MVKCSICKENVAVIFVNRFIDGKSVPLALCMACAQKQGMAPLQQMLSQSGITQEDMENLNSQMSEVLGDVNMDELIQSIPESSDNVDGENALNDDANSMLKFLNNAFSSFGPKTSGLDAKAENSDDHQHKQVKNEPKRPLKTRKTLILMVLILMKRPRKER